MPFLSSIIGHVSGEMADSYLLHQEQRTSEKSRGSARVHLQVADDGPCELVRSRCLQLTNECGYVVII